MDIWHFIERDHANIAHLIHEMPAALPGAGVVRNRGRLLDDLIDEIAHHATALAEGLYPMLRRDPGMARLLDELADDEAALVQALHSLQRQRTDRPDWHARFADASYAIDQWLHRHRHELVPAARSRLFGPELDRATEAFIRARRRSVAPRDEPFAERLLAAGAAVALVTAVTLLFRRFAAPRSDRPEGRARIGDHAASARDRARPRADHAAAAPGPRAGKADLRSRHERPLDGASEETLPTSDPIAPKRLTR